MKELIKKARELARELNVINDELHSKLRPLLIRYAKANNPEGLNIDDISIGDMNVNAIRFSTHGSFHGERESMSLLVPMEYIDNPDQFLKEQEEKRLKIKLEQERADEEKEKDEERREYERLRAKFGTEDSRS